MSIVDSLGRKTTHGLNAPLIGDQPPHRTLVRPSKVLHGRPVVLDHGGSSMVQHIRTCDL